MKIQCLPRKWFEKIKGTVLEEQVLARNKVVSIQSRSGWDSEPPFSEEGLKSPNLLCLTFDDVTDYSDLYDGEKVARFRPVMAQKILQHVGHGLWPVLIHCTEGVSRSGAVESDLKVSEDLAKADEFKMQAEFEDAEARLNRFSEFCESQLDDLRGGSTDRLLALDYWSDVIESSVDEVAEKTARQISTCNFNDLRIELSEQIINYTFADVVKPKAVAWANRIKTGKHKLFDDLVGRHVRKIIRETSRQWELVIQDQPILAGLPSPSPVGGTDVMNADLVGSVVAKAPGISSDVVVGATLGVAVGALLGSFVFPFIGTYLGGTLGAFIGAGLGGGIGEENRERQVYEELKKSLLCSISEPERKREGVEKQAKRIEALRMGIIREFQAAFEQPANALAVRHEQALNLFNEQTGRRMKIAEEHRRFRIEKLEPLRMEIAAFEKSVKNALGDKTSSDEMVSDGTRVMDDNTIWDA